MEDRVLTDCRAMEVSGSSATERVAETRFPSTELT